MVRIPGLDRIPLRKFVRSESSGKSAPTNAQARLIPMEGATSEVIRLGSGPLVIGRGSGCGLIIPEKALSRQHVRILPDGHTWRLEDLNSANGTQVDGNAVTQVLLTPGCVITLGGRVAFRFELEASAESAPSSFWASVLCPQLVPEAGGRPFVIRRRISVVGRNATADLQLAESQISGIHARIIRKDGKVILRDTGSRNGTAINGKLVQQGVLKEGDRVAFGDITFVVKPSWFPTGRGLTGGAGIVLLIATLAILYSVFMVSGDKLEPLWTRQMYLDQVETSLVAVIRAHDRTPMAREVGLAQVDIARRSLIAADLLRPDTQTEAEIQEALRNSVAAPDVHRALKGRDILEIVKNLQRDSGATLEPEQDSDSFDLATELSYLVAEFGIDTRDTPIPDDLVNEVLDFTEFWSVKKLSFTTRAISRGRELLPMMQAELRSQRLPEIFCYLPFIESGYQETVTSSVGARGLWQFMPGTARDYGLKVDEGTDERTDPLLSTRAACQHLEYLLKIFGPNSFMCAVASYNKGHNGMRRCLERGGDLQSAWKFWQLTKVHDGCLPDETAEYVPKFLAAVVVFRNPEVFGISMPD